MLLEPPYRKKPNELFGQPNRSFEPFDVSLGPSKLSIQDNCNLQERDMNYKLLSLVLAYGIHLTKM